MGARNRPPVLHHRKPGRQANFSSHNAARPKTGKQGGHDSREVRAVALIFLLALNVHAQTNRWWKGNLHTHTFWSDGDDFPEMVAEWYRTRGYNFLALTDHNVLSQGLRWMKAADITKRGGDSVLPKYQQRFGPDWVQTRKAGETLEFRLKPLDEFRALVEERGKFIMIPAEEISDRTQGVPVHINASNIREEIMPLGGATVREAIENNLRSVQEHAKRTNRETLAHLNHPNFQWAITAE